MSFKLKNATKIYPNSNNKALDNVSIEVKPSETIGLLGPNGSGKTTSATILSGLNKMQEGYIEANGKIISSKNLPLYRNKIGYCPQNSTLNSNLNVKENLYTSALYFGLSKQDAKKALESTIKEFKLTKYLNYYPSQLSGGWVKRIMIARSLIHNPELIVLDEPTVALDHAIRSKIWEIINKLKQSGKSIILITHYLEEAIMLCDNIYILDQGKVIKQSKKEDLKNDQALEDILIQLEKEEQEQE